jgi:predicted lipoprotein with Yx(FWY)xxD motif
MTKSDALLKTLLTSMDLAASHCAGRCKKRWPEVETAGSEEKLGEIMVYEWYMNNDKW